MNYKFTMAITLDEAFEYWQDYCNSPEFYSFQRSRQQEKKERLNFGEYVKLIKCTRVIVE